MVTLLNELDSIRVTKKFKRYGFALISNHNGWIKTAEKLSKSKDKKISEPAGLLANIGYAYAISKGVDTNHIVELRELFNEKVL